MEIENLKRLIKIQLLRIKNFNEKKFEDAKSQSFLKLDFMKEISTKEKHLKPYGSLRKIPKRISKINFEEKNFSNIFNTSSPKIVNKYKININDKFSNMMNQLKSDCNNISNSKNLMNFKGTKFKNKFIFKFGIIEENYTKLKLKSDNISEFNKNNFDKYVQKIISCIKNQTSLLFNSIIDYEKNEIQELITNLEEYSSYIIKLFNILLNEVNSKTENNNNVSKLNRDFETEINMNNLEIEKINRIVNDPKLKQIFSTKEKAEKQIEIIKFDFLKEKNEYKIIINDLTKEIKNLYKMLNKNKEYYDLFLKDESKIKEQKNEIRELKKKHLEEINLLKGEILNDKNVMDELNKKIEELNNEIKEKEKIEKININHKIQMKNLQLQNMKICENYLMVKEDLDSFLYIRNNNPKNYF